MGHFLILVFNNTYFKIRRVVLANLDIRWCVFMLGRYYSKLGWSRIYCCQFPSWHPDILSPTADVYRQCMTVFKVYIYIVLFLRRYPITVFHPHRLRYIISCSSVCLLIWKHYYEKCYTCIEILWTKWKHFWQPGNRILRYI